MTCTIRRPLLGGTCSGDSMICGDGVRRIDCGEACDDGNLDERRRLLLRPARPSSSAAGATAGCRRPSRPSGEDPAQGQVPRQQDSLGLELDARRATLRRPTSDRRRRRPIPALHLRRRARSRHVGAAPAGPALRRAARAGGRPAAASRTRTSDATPDGLTQIVTLKQGGAGEGEDPRQGKGRDLPRATLPMTQPVTVQLRNSPRRLLGSALTAAREEERRDAIPGQVGLIARETSRQSWRRWCNRSLAATIALVSGRLRCTRRC